MADSEIKLRKVDIAPGTDLNDLTADDATENKPQPYEEDSAYNIDHFRSLATEDTFVSLKIRKKFSRPAIDERFTKVETGGTYDNGKPIRMRASTWLAQNSSVECEYWMPGQPQIMRNVIVNEGGIQYADGFHTYNSYLPSQIGIGNAEEAGKWITLIETLYPNEFEHIINWLAFKVQNPGTKLNHALVLGGEPGIGKDSLLAAPIKAVGEHNAADVSPDMLLSDFNGYVRSVILRINEASDMGKRERLKFYEQTKTLIAAPPEQLRCNVKHSKVHPVANVCGVVMTTNHKTGGIHIPENDRRHFIAWSQKTKSNNFFNNGYFNRLWEWYENGGYEHVAAYLHSIDLSNFDPKAPPRKTQAFYEFVDAGQHPISSKFATVLEEAKWPDVITIEGLRRAAGHDVVKWLEEPKNHRSLPYRMEDNGYSKVLNPDRKDNRWTINGKAQNVYGINQISTQKLISKIKAL